MAKVVSIEAALRADVALRCVDDLLPGLPPRRRKLMAATILTMLGDERRGGPPVPVKTVVLKRLTSRRLTPEVLTELLMVHSNCVHDQTGRCPLMVSVRSLTWEINQFCGLANDEDRGFKRRSEMLAARPLNRVMECFCEEADNDRDVRPDRPDDV